MCGIAGFVASGALRPGDRNVLSAMTSAIAHRGPDDSGAWFDEELGVALGHRRLSIIDLSPAGHQPMASVSGRYVLVYNGEIYNYRDIRLELESAGFAPQWRGHSDTEVMVAAFDAWGIHATLERLNGMFAFAVWDQQTRKLTLARDRLGEKPLYYGRSGGTFLFGSELKALTEHPDFVREVNREALTLFLRYNNVPAPHSIWTGIFKLPAAHSIEIGADGHPSGQPQPYWDFRSIAAEGAANPLSDEPHLSGELEELLKDAVLRRMEADVPLGAFLSGGVDSSLIVALMQAQSSRKVRTFTIGFHEESHNEAQHAGAVARHLGTDHTELYVTADDALELVPQLPTLWDEPFADSSQIPTHLVSRLTRQQVTVALSGDGGDELFGGYNRYVAGMRLWSFASKLSPPARKALAGIVRSPATAKGANAFMRMMPKGRRYLGIADSLPKIAHTLEVGSQEELYTRFVSHFTNPADMVIGGSEGAAADSPPDLGDFRRTMMYLDTLTYLPDDILTKVDRASMAVSLETRVPFLDHRVVEFASRLPIEAKIRDGTGKQILREILYRHVPRTLIERPKAGFGMPVAQWLSGPLRGWAEDLLDEGRLRSEGFLDARSVRKLWEEQLRTGGKHHMIWDILMFQAWWAHQSNGAGASHSAPPLLAARSA